jgi:hypothetical protein
MRKLSGSRLIAEIESAINRLELRERETVRDLKDAHLDDARKSREFVRRFLPSSQVRDSEGVDIAIGLRVLDERLELLHD